MYKVNKNYSSTQFSVSVLCIAAFTMSHPIATNCITILVMIAVRNLSPFLFSLFYSTVILCVW